MAPPPLHRSRLLLLSTHLVVALVALVTVGGATRVMEAGLACPDWPLCYGSVLPTAEMTVRVFLEWFHRLDGLLVALGLLLLAALSWGQRRQLPPAVPVLATTAVLLVAVQVALGALTVTQLLRFDIVTAHLATGLLLVALLSLLRQRLRLALEPLLSDVGGALTGPWRRWPALAALLVYLQCVFGGLLASQWATGRCLQLLQACHWLTAHRLLAGAALLAVVVLPLKAAAAAWPRPARHLAFAAGLLVLLQAGLGLLTLHLHLSQPLVTVAHQLGAALLLGLLTSLAGLLHPLSSSP
ncbi:MAG: heme A synthase [Synechococcus sp. SB0668_bin_15]|nr:heme A synthase [Synechococcus sp. SB0668_bin_15]MXZ82112.1 heme A synthase [Synechococcus sp. SB0666_bin_14]MYC49344.1 heme A synthase [Synechococcus sp. SB0662_bin_14]MYG45946.1 heme A synthase [Synechococcus sp. SB0675_bin_6]MYJ59840.1 heme A synthase [Synechococcus sp. SB0672_bin_6]MYK90959.1 heme A synthase [Synechococcus sp. SB0669_bin_8]